ncbi:MAG TPA: hypothetical protein PKE25_08320 [Novosphingobium sp.]|nr:hypothetical protein [Novosphingobium sp.]
MAGGLKGHAPPRADLAGKRVLFSAPRFFGYEQEIAAELHRRGAQVDFLADRPFDSPLLHAAARFSRRAVLLHTDRHYRRTMAGFDGGAYDHVLIVNGQTMPRALLAEIRRDNPHARFTLYMWDSLANRRDALGLLDLFDRAFSFDPDAARQHAMRFRPLFFAPAYEAPAEPQEIVHDLSFIGTAHTDRHAVVSRLDATLDPQVRRFWYLYLQARWVWLAYRLTNPAFRQAPMADFRFTPLPRAEGVRAFWQSRAILDIEHPRQTGLTIRTFETLGARRKLVTTNAGIRDYALFDPALIQVIDRQAPRVDRSFLLEDAPGLEEAVRRRYSLAGWLDEVLAEADHSADHLA